jgi:predicted lactoylglutathione lyase
MSTKIFVNLPVKDLQKSVAFFTSLGFTFNKQFTNENGACLVISEDIYAMLLTNKFFKTFMKKEITDTAKSIEVINALMLDDRPSVDELAEKAFKAGAQKLRDPEDMGFMYSRSFIDLDGHHWEIGWMDPNHVNTENQ